MKIDSQEEVMATTSDILDDILHELAEANINLDYIPENTLFDIIQKHIEKVADYPEYAKQNG